MSFKVEHEDLESYAKQLGRVSEDAEQAKRYVGQHTNADVSDGLLISAFGAPHQDVVQKVKDALQKVQDIAKGSQNELSSAAKYYRDTDESNAEAVDATYPASKR
ncbi:type VII secretion target [Streptomyces sp. XM4193]|uniref:type VII secretion target n=1 Tax=Streptomyces sp. XM4193 TaxID=2929782 RepID=UPI001FFB373A|nr:type VII secretion target [Streptomyces sp. XM4193]MCK1794517.1 type VII secretion target [Streptomyces sp. XM4193]